MSTAIVIIGTAVAVIWLSLHALLRLTQDWREPPALFTTIPFLSPILEMVKRKGKFGFYASIRDEFGLPIYTLRLPGARLYIVNSPGLLPAIRRQDDDSISFTPLLMASVRKVAGIRNFAYKKVEGDSDRPDSELFITNFLKFTKPAYSPGPFLDGHVRLSAQRLADGMQKLQDGCLTNSSEAPRMVLDLFGWIKTEMYLASSDAVKFERSIIHLLVNPLAGLVCRDSIRSREELFRAWKNYFVSGAENDTDASEVIKRRIKYRTSHNCSVDDYTRFELSHLLGVIGNVTNATMWLVFRIYSDPAVLRDIREEVWQLVTKTAADKQYNSDKESDEDLVPAIYTMDITNILSRCPILFSTFREVLRVHFAGATARVLTRDHILDNRYLLKKGGILLMPGSVYHSEPVVWGSTVAEFDHKRFLRPQTTTSTAHAASDENPKTKKPNPAVELRAFGGGSHLCPGRHFAAVEAMTFAALAVARFDVRPITEQSRDDGGACSGPGPGPSIWPMPTSDNASGFSGVPRPDNDIKVEVMLCERAGRKNPNQWRVIYSGMTDKTPGTREVGDEHALGI